MSSMENTVKFTGDELEEQKVRDVLMKVYSALEEKGYLS